MKVKFQIALIQVFCIIFVLLVGAQVVTVNAAEEIQRPIYLIDENFSFFPKNGLPSGWDTLTAGGQIISQYCSSFQVVDSSDILPVTMKRKFKQQTSGVVTLEYRIKYEKLVGADWNLLSGQTKAINISYVDDNLVLISKGESIILVNQLQKSNEYGIKLVVDIDKNILNVYVNGILVAEKAKFTNSVTSLDAFEVKTSDIGVGNFYFWYVKLYKGYAVNERMLQTVTGYFPSDWEVSKGSGAVSSAKMNSTTNPDIYSMKLEDTSNSGSTTVTKNFEEQNNALIWEYNIYMPKKVDGINAEIMASNNVVMAVGTDNGNFAYKNAEGKFLPIYEYIGNLWYNVKVKFSLDMKTATIYINGKERAKDISVLSSPKGINKIQYETSKTAVGEIWIDDILVYNNVPLPEDYVKPPQKAKENEYIVGMQSCSLWRDGYHNGWDVINATPERKSYLGFYDEGLPEVADWEIKWLAEHGVDYELYCWFRPSYGETQPIKTPYSSYALHDGYFAAEYSNDFKFAIMWENAASKAQDSVDFRTNVVPYWIEYYFKDPRYLKVNNKPVISLYSLKGLLRDFKTVEGVRAETDYLREQCKKIGFDGAIILASSSSTDQAYLQQLKDCGIDILYTYNWGNMSGYADTQKVGMESQLKDSIIDKMGTYIMGWNDTAWFGKGGRYNTPEEYKNLLKWGRDEYMTKIDNNSLGKNMVMLGNWNEFGEGHFTFPCEVAGFGYLDAINEVFGNNDKYDDTRPTEKQIERVTNIYVPGRTVPLNTMNQPIEIPKIAVKEWGFNTNAEGWVITKQVDNLEVKDGAISGVSTDADPGIISSDNLNIDISDVTYIKVRMKNETPDVGACFYFITNSDTSWAENKSLPFYIDPNSDFKDYYVYIGANALWTGTLKQLRLDPTKAPGKFSVDSITFLTESNNGSIKVKIDGKTQSFKDKPLVMNGRTLVPMREFFEKIGAKVDWDEDTKTITAVNKKNVIFLRIGMNKAISQQKIYNLDQAPVIIDGKTYIPLRFVGQATGSKVDWDEKTNMVSLTSGSGTEQVAVVESNVGRTAWEFNVNGNLSGWKPNNQIEDVVVENGAMSGNSIGIDPFLVSADGLALDASKIKSFNIKMKNSTTSNNLVLYYTTNEDPAWSEEKTLRIILKPNDKTLSEYTIDTTKKEKFKGTIKQLRLDLVDKDGTFDIDYIKFITQ